MDGSKDSIFVLGHRYVVTESCIEGILNTRDWADFHGQPFGIKWYIELKAISFDAQKSLEISFNGLGLQLDSWRELTGIEVNWNTWKNPNTGASYVLVKHEKLESPDSGKLHITGLGGNVFSIRSNGYLGKRELYQIDMRFTFFGIRVFGTENEIDRDLQSRLENQLPADLMIHNEFIRDTDASPPKTSAFFIPVLE